MRRVPDTEWDDIIELPAGSFGLSTFFDLAGCDRELIAEPGTILNFKVVVLARIEMLAHGAPTLERFALHDPVAAGYTLLQLITTSHLAVHFAEETGGVHVDVFSCRAYRPRTVVGVARQFFKGDLAGCEVFIR